MIVTISGPPGSGKTTVAQLLAKRTGFDLISAGKRFREMATERDLTLSELGALAKQDHSIDKKLDEEVIHQVRQCIQKKRNVVVDGRLAGQMLRREGIQSLKVWIDCPLKVRASRVADRDGIAIAQATKNIIEREALEAERYHYIYGMKLRDPRVYDLVLDSSDDSPEEIVDLITDKMAELGG